MASFTFNDGTGSQTLQSSWPAPANRFNDWTPVPVYIGQRAIGLGDRVRYQYVLATSQAASGRLDGIAIADEAILRAFKLWAEGGGTFTVTTGDSESNTYADCQLASDRDGNPIDLEIIKDNKRRTYSVAFTIEHVGSPQLVLRAVYGPRTALTFDLEAGASTISGNDAEFGIPLASGDDSAFTVTGNDAGWSIT